MKDIKSILATLDRTSRSKLDYAFENELPHILVEYAPGKFIGVNVQPRANLTIELTAGLYSAGLIIQGQAIVP